MDRVSIDIETMGNRPDAAIVQIGAYLIRGLEEQPDPGRSFLANVDLASCLRYGLSVDASTIYWWLSQGAVARESLTTPPPAGLKKTLGDLTIWFQHQRLNRNTVEMWSHSSFDAAILHNAYRAVDLNPPWRFPNALDLRTLRYVPGDNIDLKRGSAQEHIASWDAFAQGQEVARKLESQ